jgi:RNA polymerase sigma-70 factor (ECF subfamily)
MAIGDEDVLLEAARGGDEDAFARVIEPYRGALLAHCYRLLGSAADAEDALQDALLRAWRGLPGFEGRSSLRSWLYTIATNASLKLIEKRPTRTLPVEYSPAFDPAAPELEGPLAESVWVEPFPDAGIAAATTEPAARYDQRESVELAFIAALQHLPARQRAVLLMRDVLGFSPAEIADSLDSTPASIYSALQRAHEAVDEKLPAMSQQQALGAVPDAKLRDVVRRYVRAWENHDVAAIQALLADDVVFAMPPTPRWYRGVEDVGAFMRRQPLKPSRQWRLAEISANGQVAFAIYGRHADDEPFTGHGIKLLTFNASGAISEVIAYLTADSFERFGLPMQLA